MSLTLILMRHAKSSWDDPLLDDFDRPLNPRGREAAVAIGRWLADKGYLPGEAIVSGACRTSETWGLVSGQLPGSAALRTEGALYHASPDVILRVARTATAGSVILIGHNPGIGELAGMLDRASPHPPGLAAFPTAATAVFSVDAAEWSGLDAGRCRQIDYAQPRDLT